MNQKGQYGQASEEVSGMSSSQITGMLVFLLHSIFEEKLLENFKQERI